MSLSFIVMIEEGLTLIKIMFVCFGNICRSPMAEFVMKHLVRQAGLEGKVIIESSGTDPTIERSITSSAWIRCAPGLQRAARGDSA